MGYLDTSVTFHAVYNGFCDDTVKFSLLEYKPNAIEPTSLDIHYDIRPNCSTRLVTATITGTEYFNNTVLEFAAIPTPKQGDITYISCSDNFTVIIQGKVYTII